MTNLQGYILPLAIYVFAARYSLSASNKRIRDLLFLSVNLGAFVWLSLLTRWNTWNEETIWSLGGEIVLRHIFLVGVYVAAIAAGYYLVRFFVKRELHFLPALLYPIFLLVAVKLFPDFWNSLFDTLDWENWSFGAAIIGLSYMAFRLSYLVLEVRNGVVTMPTLSEYLGFAFFLPTLVVGPISRFSLHQRSIETDETSGLPPERALMRIIVGTTKYFFLANLANQLSYGGIFMDGRPHGLFDLGVAVVFYYLFLYLNFSGFCDIAIGVAALVGIRVSENFNNPFAAHNVKDFWNRWHITLSQYTRDMIFAPLSTSLVRKWGVKYTNFSIAVSIFVVFIVIGLWHGFGPRFALFGLVHAVGVIANHYYTIFLKRRLGRQRYKRYNENPFVNVVATVLTFVYVALSFAVFANGRTMLFIIKDALTAGV